MDENLKDDLDLAARVAQGDAGAFDELYAQYADLVFGFIFHQLYGARSDAEEVWQDTFLTALRALPSYEGRSRLGSWLCSIARHKAADRLRQLSRPAKTVLSMSPAGLVELMDTSPLPEELLNQGATCARVSEALAGLPADQRTALVARYANGESVEQVSERLGRTYKATESLLSRARSALRQALSQSLT